MEKLVIPVIVVILCSLYHTSARRIEVTHDLLSAECELDGRTYRDGEEMPSSDPCRLGCFCVGYDGEPTCAIMRCALPQCVGNQYEVKPGQCCPSCKEGADRCYLENGDHIFAQDLWAENTEDGRCFRTCHCPMSGQHTTSGGRMLAECETNCRAVIAPSV